METDFYRYGFQLQEKDDEFKGKGNSLNFEYRIHDPQVGRFFSVDPEVKKFPNISGYGFCMDNTISTIEKMGREPGDPTEVHSNLFFGFTIIHTINYKQIKTHVENEFYLNMTYVKSSMFSSELNLNQKINLSSSSILFNKDLSLSTLTNLSQDFSILNFSAELNLKTSTKFENLELSSNANFRRNEDKPEFLVAAEESIESILPIENDAENAISSLPILQIKPIQKNIKLDLISESLMKDQQKRLVNYNGEKEIHLKKIKTNDLLKNPYSKKTPKH